MLSKILAAVLPLSVLANNKFFAVSTGRHFSFIVDKGVVKAMGRNQYGQLGLSSTEDQEEPQVVPFGDDTLVSAVAAGAFHTLFLTEGGEVWVAGRNHHGQLGDGTTTTRPGLKKLDITGVAGVAAGYAHSVFHMQDGYVKAVGLNSVGQLGDLTTDSKSTPGNVPFGNHAAPVVLAQSESSSSTEANATTAAPTTAAPTPVPTTPSPTPAPTPAPTKATAIAAGYDFTYILTDAGEVWAMGQNLGGQLGLGFSNPKLTATKVFMGDDTIVNMAAGESHGLFVASHPGMQNYGVCSTGANFAGQLGNGDTEKRGNRICIETDSGAKAVAAGGDTSCLADFQLFCWGSNRFGQLGLGATAAEFYSSRQKVEGVDLADDMALGDTHSLFLNHDDVMIAGSNSYGELGDNSSDRFEKATVLVKLERPLRTSTTLAPTPTPPVAPAPTPILAPTPAPAPTPETTRSNNTAAGGWPWQMLVGGIATGLGVVLVVVCILDRRAPAAEGPESTELAATA